MTLNERRRLVLKALVEEYVHTGQPVGSRNIVERSGLKCSSATVRSELGALEESGYAFQPHVSSGRIPTDAGYRLFVDGLLDSGDIARAVDPAEVRRRYFELSDEVDDLMRQTSVVLSHLTHYVAVVLAPTISKARIKRVDLLALGERRALVVLITESGQVVNRHLEFAETIDPDQIARIERALNASLGGKHAPDVRPLREALDRTQVDDRIYSVVLDEIIACLDEADRDRLYHVGVPELLALPEFAESARLRPLMGLLEDGLAMLDTLGEVMRAKDMTVRIGRENTRTELGDMSLIATNYGGDQCDGIVGVIGPTRMDYPRTISAVRGVAEGLDEVLG